jgi:hypothetical protein
MAQQTRATRHPAYDLFEARSQAAERMLGEPTTPLFSISDFISLELYQARAFDTSATSWRSSTSLGPSVLRNTLLLVMPADVRFFSFPLLTRLPCVKILDLEVESQIFVIHRYSPL